jgi:hypothetical protein
MKSSSSPQWEAVRLESFENELKEGLSDNKNLVRYRFAYNVLRRRFQFRPRRESYEFDWCSAVGFAAMLKYHLHCECSDPRDRVYGLLGFIDWPSQLTTTLRPEYSISPAELAKRILAFAEKERLDVKELELILYTEFGWDQEWAKDVPKALQ